MRGLKVRIRILLLIIPFSFIFSGCTVKAVGDPNRPITINAHITLDIKGLTDTATDIEDFVRGETPKTNSNSN
ncbi:MAG TPA: hypothetical protein DD723_00370 [Candidatus Omnitrophica bacterium]|nr:MAG: hypothetical protein A2Z81_04640 [Omnitrophica WOR_2 bacterium GWA2_45_18]OGX19185.1 MAG: hypothetical protein A2Y04_04505 [Omnitrophica WOR_2 bacterium GWC2_45_7]HBR13985.1 hypothetical protein [Candidatus Omnitrophota bacterium]